MALGVAGLYLLLEVIQAALELGLQLQELTVTQVDRLLGADNHGVMEYFFVIRGHFL